MTVVEVENSGGKREETSARTATAESVRSLTKAAVVRGGGSRHFCPSAEKTRECNHVVQCVTRELEVLTGIPPGCFVDSDEFPRRGSRVHQFAAVDTRITVNLESTCQKR